MDIALANAPAPSFLGNLNAEGRRHRTICRLLREHMQKPPRVGTQEGSSQGLPQSIESSQGPPQSPESSQGPPQSPE